jgi:hypothetical protein
VSSKGGPYPFDCARFRVTKSVRRRSIIVDHRVSELHEGRMPKSDTPTREVPSSERCEYLGPSQRLHVESADQKGIPARIAVSGSRS